MAASIILLIFGIVFLVSTFVSLFYVYYFMNEEVWKGTWTALVVMLSSLFLGVSLIMSSVYVSTLVNLVR